MINAEYVKDFDIVIATEMSFSVLVLASLNIAKVAVPERLHPTSQHSVLRSISPWIIWHRLCRPHRT
jgi:hypothetical protein